ncbi:hypothetical protein [Streptomyces mirabilis]|uniref:hypothetical protein n=1 Tax=Streptomyces mirabilis TaxID=68239 RepID=UPI003677043F
MDRLGRGAPRALEPTDTLCLDSLRRGDVVAFAHQCAHQCARQCARGAEPREFCVCAWLADV